MSHFRPAAVLLLVVALIGVLAVPCCCNARRNIRNTDDTLLVGPEQVDRPNRPKVFTSPEELRGYLEALSTYYAIAGRPRFGKRVPAQHFPHFSKSDFRHPVRGDFLDLPELPPMED